MMQHIITTLLIFLEKVLNQANGYDISSFVKSLNSKLNSQTSSKMFSDGSTNIYKIEADFSIANSMSEVKASDHLLTIVNDVLGEADQKLGGGPAEGIADIGGKNSYIEYGGNSLMVQNGFHELGHNMGFGHASPKAADYNSDPMGYASGSLNFSRDQLRMLYNRGSKSGLLNKGYNREFISNKVPIYNHQSTNERPYRGQRTYNMIISKRIKND